MKINIGATMLFCMLFFCGFSSFAQDIIIKLNGDEIQSIVVEIEETKIKYRRFDNAEGPLYSIAKSEVFMIRYKNGSKDVFNQAAPAPAATPAPQPKPTPAPAQATSTTVQPAPQQAAPATSVPATTQPATTYTQTARTYLAYTGGSYAPYGVGIGVLTNGGGFIINARFSGNALGDVSIYEMTDNGGIDDDFWNWYYTGVAEYRRGAITASYVVNVAGSVDRLSLHVYGGLGYGFANYMYEYEQIGDSGDSYGYEMIKYVDVSKSSVEFESGLIFDTGGFNLSLGVSSLEFTEHMLTFGIGASF